MNAPDRKPSKIATIITWTFIILLSAVIINSITSHPNQSTPTQDRQSARASVGDRCFIDSGSDLTPIARTEQDLDEWFKASRAKDDYGQKILLVSGRIFGVEKRTAVLVIDSSFLLYKVRVQGGEQNGRAGWIPKEHVKILPK